MSIIGAALRGGVGSLVDPQGVPLSYFGIHFQADITQPTWIPAPSLPFGAYRISGRVNWRRIETSQGVYNFLAGTAPAPTASLDRYVYEANYRGLDLIYQFLETPTWSGGVAGQTWPPNSWQDLTDFVTTVATRYASKIKYWEIMNEPNYFQGTTAQLVTWAQTVYNAIKAVSPSLIVLSPSPTTSGTPSGTPASVIDSYLGAGGTPYQDIMAFHGYQSVAGSESELVGIIQNYKAKVASYGLSNLPLWSTEGSWGFNSSFTDDDARAAFVAKYFLLQWGLGVSRVYWYAYDDNTLGDVSPASSAGFGTLYAAGLTKAGVAYGEVFKWMKGARVALYSTSGSVWSVPVMRPLRGYGALAVWDSGGGPTSYLPDPKYKQWRDLSGDVMPISGAVTLNASPVLLETGSTW